MSFDNGLITFLPEDEAASLPWWMVEDGVVTARGAVHPDSDDGAFPVAETQMPVMALISATRSIVRWTDMGELAPRQAEAAAKLKIAEETLEPSGGLQSAAVHGDDSRVLIVSMSDADLQSGLDMLARYDLNPDIIMPAGLVLPATEEGILRADFGSEIALLRRRDIISPDEPALRTALWPDQAMTELGTEELDACLARALAAPPINLRTGKFAKKNRMVAITPHQWRVIAWLLLAGLLLSVLLAAATYWRYDNAAAREDERALTAARKIAPQVADAENALSALDKELIRKGAAGRQFTAPASALYAQIKSVQGARLSAMRYSGDGILAVTLSAPTVGPINAILAGLQEQGYVVTATPRQEASGLTLADITMRLP